MIYHPKPQRKRSTRTRHQMMRSRKSRKCKSPILTLNKPTSARTVAQAEARSSKIQDQSIGLWVSSAKRSKRRRISRARRLKKSIAQTMETSSMMVIRMSQRMIPCSWGCRITFLGSSPTTSPNPSWSCASPFRWRKRKRHLSLSRSRIWFSRKLRRRLLRLWKKNRAVPKRKCRYPFSLLGMLSFPQAKCMPTRLRS